MKIKIILQLLFISLLFFYISGCGKKEALKEIKKFSKSEGKSILDTILSLKEMRNGTAAFRMRSGKLVNVEMRDYEKEDERLNESSGKSNSKKCNSDEFAGYDRRASKTSVADVKYEDFKDLNDLITTLPPDHDMQKHEPVITKNVNSQRVDEELRNVKVEHVFIYAIYREPDNDYHVILGSTASIAGREYLTAEISGLPSSSSSSYNALYHARNEIEEYFGELSCGKKYIFNEDPIEVEIEGSLFYDIDHAPGEVGAGKYKPATSWEIHPVTNGCLND